MDAPTSGKKGAPVAAPVDAPTAGKKGAPVASPVDAPTTGKKGAPVDAPTSGKKEAPIFAPISAPSAGKKGLLASADIDGTVVEDDGEEEEEDVDIAYISESNKAQGGSSGLSRPALVGTIFGALLALLICVNVTFLCLSWRSQGGSSDCDGDPYGTTITVDDLKGGKILVKKVIPASTGGKDIVQKTVYPDRGTAAGHGFVSG